MKILSELNSILGARMTFGNYCGYTEGHLRPVLDVQHRIVHIALS